jgi:hypothetical protein
MVNVSDTLGWETNTMVTKPATIFRLTGKIVFVANTIVLVIETMVFVNITMVETSDATVAAAKKMVSVALTMVCNVLTIGFVIIEQSFANPKLVFFGARSPLASVVILEIHQQIQLTSTAPAYLRFKIFSSFLFICCFRKTGRAAPMLAVAVFYTSSMRGHGPYNVKIIAN